MKTGEELLAKYSKNSWFDIPLEEANQLFEYLISLPESTSFPHHYAGIRKSLRERYIKEKLKKGKLGKLIYEV